MTMQKVHLDISSDIFDKVFYFLNQLPKNKIQVTIEHDSKENLTPQQHQSIFEDFLTYSQEVKTVQKFDRDALHER